MQQQNRGSTKVLIINRKLRDDLLSREVKSQNFQPGFGLIFGGESHGDGDSGPGTRKIYQRTSQQLINNIHSATPRIPFEAENRARPYLSILYHPNGLVNAHAMPVVPMAFPLLLYSTITSSWSKTPLEKTPNKRYFADLFSKSKFICACYSLLISRV